MEDGPVQWSRIPRPTMQELPRLHQELGIWMSNARYQLSEVDRIPLWRVQNTSMTVATGAGIGVYFLMKRYRPSIKFPIDVIPPFVTFYLTHRTAQVYQMPGLWDSFLSLPSQLGSTSRGILEALRKGQRLPSDEFGAAGTRPRPMPVPAASSSSKEPAAQVEPLAPSAGGVSMPSPVESSTPSWGSGGYTAQMPQDPPAPAAPDPWALPDAGATPGAAPSSPWGTAGSESWGGGEQAAAPPKRMSWDEIRARNAAKEGQRSQ
eukprot:TRINITY_DN30698_c0_g1_i1.p1 TRINITY_DN30698_c0_g1~~TRINITY_DN30698_c0_g1_i1.p1  ORF type:complete len:298 (-),score=46.18 TRINITY_DN30698_c0_g1_i1:20-808(-)